MDQDRRLYERWASGEITDAEYRLTLGQTHATMTPKEERSMPDTQSKINYDARTAYKVGIKLNRRTDADLIEMLEAADSKQALIKEALRAYRQKWSGHLDTLPTTMSGDKREEITKMTIRERMQETGESLGWCKPYVSEDGQYALAINEGEVAGMILNGEDIKADKLDKADLLERFARVVNPDYDDYSGWDDLHIALEGKVRECGCASCPWFGICDAMDGE